MSGLDMHTKYKNWVFGDVSNISTNRISLLPYSYIKYGQIWWNQDRKSWHIWKSPYYNFLTMYLHSTHVLGLVRKGWPGLVGYEEWMLFDGKINVVNDILSCIYYLWSYLNIMYTDNMIYICLTQISCIQPWLVLQFTGTPCMQHDMKILRTSQTLDQVDISMRLSGGFFLFPLLFSWKM